MARKIEERRIVKHNSIEDLVSNGCVPTGCCNCDYCPFVIYPTDGDGRYCEKELFDECVGGISE